jgi:hypothetical protein
MNGLLQYHVQINLRWPLRVICTFWTAKHDWEQVHSIHPLLGFGYQYCKRCGKGWRTGGLDHTPRFCRHEWTDYGLPSMVVSTNEPFRQMQKCPHCGGTRVIECATGKVVA